MTKGRPSRSSPTNKVIRAKKKGISLVAAVLMPAPGQMG